MKKRAAESSLSRRGLTWRARFPGAVKDAGPYRFHQPTSRYKFREFLCSYFGLDEVPRYTKIWCDDQKKEETA